jgi:hypothetical protein
MSDEADQAILQSLRDAQSRLNDVLGRAHQAGLTVDLKINTHGVVGNPAPLLHVSGRAIRARVELDERL